jgi:hypothetical protein
MTRLVWIWLALLLVCSAGEAAAQEAAPPVTMIVPTDREEEISRLVVRAVQSQLSDLPVTFRLSPVSELPGALKEQISLAEQVAAEGGALAVFWCDFTDPGQALLFLRGTDRDRILVRRIDATEAAALSEEVAIIVRASVAELLRGGRIGIQVAEAVAAEQPPALIEPAAEGLPSVLEIAQRTGYLFQTLSTEQPASHGLDLMLGVRAHPVVWAFFGFTMVGTLSQDGDAAALRLRRHPLRLGAAALFRIGMFEVGASLAAQLDYVTFEVRGLDEGMAAVRDRDDVLLSLVPEGVAGLRILPRAVLVATVGFEIPVSAVHYVVQTPRGTEILLDPWPVQPRFSVGVRIELW